MHTVFALVVIRPARMDRARWLVIETPTFWAWHLLTADFTAVMAGLAASVLLVVAVLAVGWFRRPSHADADAIKAGLREPGDA